MEKFTIKCNVCGSEEVSAIATERCSVVIECDHCENEGHYLEEIKMKILNV